MTETSYYPPAAAARPDGGADASWPVQLAVTGPGAQRRPTVALRLILAVPHLIALYALGVAASAVAVTGWLGALATGRLPGFAAGFLAGYLRWYCRVAAYLLLLTDEYPPFASRDIAYPVRMTARPGRLSRITVLFRVPVAIPAVIVSVLVASGVATIVIFIGWLTALVAGRLPASLHQALAAVLRYGARVSGYLYLLTETYPAGLFGDSPGVQPQAVPLDAHGGGTTTVGRAAADAGYGTPPAGYGAPGYGTPVAGYGTPATAPPGYGPARWQAPPAGYGAPGCNAPGYGFPDGHREPALGYGAPGYGAPGYGTATSSGSPHPVPAGQAADWRLVLSAGARRLVGVFLLLGLLAAAGEGAWAGVTISSIMQRDREIGQLNAAIAQHNSAVARFDRAVAQEQGAAAQVANALTQVSEAHDSLASALNSPAANAGNCSTVSCFNVTALPVAHAFAAFGRTLHATTVPAASAAIANRLGSDTAGNERDWAGISQATSFSSVEDIATAAEKVGGQFDDDYAALLKSLGQAQAALQDKAAALDDQATALNGRAAALSRQAAALGTVVSARTAQGPS